MLSVTGAVKAFGRRRSVGQRDAVRRRRGRADQARPYKPPATKALRMLAFLLVLSFYLVRLTQSVLRHRLRRYGKLHEPIRIAFRARPKPTWVRREVIRLKALMREAGTCRAIEKTFNRRFARKKHMTVGRTFVNELIRRHRYQIELEQRRIKNR
ncbi:MAG TPA: hypothetical protein VEK83_02525, partial [Gemmatimonadales bacterium]|nr:hypothetical protein [Gemmatimonadales bacterium]